MKTGLPKPASTPLNLGQIVNFPTLMKADNYSPDTIDRYSKILMTLTRRGANLDDAKSTKQAIALQEWTNGAKQIATNTALLYFKYNNITDQLPKYKHTDKMVFIPTENEIDQLISGCKHQLATFMQTLKETASRYGEALKLQWTDLNTESSTISINAPEKGSNARAIKISMKLLTMLATLPHDRKTIFQYKNKDILRKAFYRARKRIAANTGNPRILQIHFHTLPHWKATQVLHQTGNIYTVMKLLGHKSLSNTQKYIGLLPDLTDDYICETARTTQEIIKLVEKGFEYITDNNGEKIFRKRK
jgi:integrase